MKKVFEKIQNAQTVTLNFVGDSITYGMSHCREEETYVAKFASFVARHFHGHTVNRYDGIFESELGAMTSFDGPILVSHGTEGCIDVIRNGIGGNTALRAYKRIDDFTGVLPNGKRADITFLMFGINDALKSDPAKYVSADAFKENYKMLIREIRKRDPETVLVIMNATYNDQTVDEHCEKTVELAREENIPLIDLHKLWTDHYNPDVYNFGHGDWLAGGGDACHPTPMAAEITAKYAFDKFIELLLG